MSVNTLDCLQKLGFQKTPFGVEYDNGMFRCFVINDGRSFYYVEWQANEAGFGVQNVWMPPRETRIWAEFPDWNQFLAGFSFILTQAKYANLREIVNTLGADIASAVVEGGRHFREFEPIRKFVSSRDVADSDFIAIEKYVMSDDSTFSGYWKIKEEIRIATRWSMGGFCYAREIPSNKAREYDEILRYHQLRDESQKFNDEKPFKLVISFGRCGLPRISIDLARKRIEVRVQLEGSVVSKTCIDYSTPDAVSEKVLCNQRKDFHCNEERWCQILKAFDACNFMRWCYGDCYSIGKEYEAIDQIEVTTFNGNRIIRRFEVSKWVSDYVRFGLENLICSIDPRFIALLQFDRLFRDVDNK